MKQVELKEMPEPVPHLCERCGGLMRLIGSERHPVEVKTDLLTYCCTSCDEFLVLPTESQATRLRLVGSAGFFLDGDSQNRISIKPRSHLKADNSHVTPIRCESCRGKAHLADCAPCAISAGIREIWTFKCEACSECSKRVVER